MCACHVPAHFSSETQSAPEPLFVAPRPGLGHLEPIQKHGHVNSVSSEVLGARRFEKEAAKLENFSHCAFQRIELNGKVWARWYEQVSGHRISNPSISQLLSFVTQASNG